MSKGQLGCIVVLPCLAGTIFFLVALFNTTELQTALMLGGLGAFMALCLGLQSLPSAPPPPPPVHSKQRGIERKLDFLRRHWKSSPVGLVIWILMGACFGGVMLGGALVSLLYWGLGVPEPFSQPIFRVPGSGLFDPLIFLLSGLLFTWLVFIPLSDWMDRLDAPKGDQTEQEDLV